jgi:hypothetical protein
MIHHNEPWTQIAFLNDQNQYRDVFRAKLLSIRLPKRLLVAYKEQGQQSSAFYATINNVKSGNTIIKSTFSFGGL